MIRDGGCRFSEKIMLKVNKWGRRTDYKPAAPCPAIEIVAGAASPVTLRDALTVAICLVCATRS
jgi:hypothetical protein